MRLGPKLRHPFFCRRTLYTSCLVAGLLLSVGGSMCKANSVYDVDLYVDANEEDAQDTLSTSVSVCDCNYWFRVRWRAGESSPNPPDSRDNPFNIEIWQPGDTRGDGTKIWWKNNIADVDPGWQQEVNEISDPCALEPGTHDIHAYALRVGTDDWVRSNKCTVTVSGSCTQAYKYAYANKSVSDVIGNSCTIKTRYGTLCCEGSGTDATFSNASCHVVEDANSNHWGETGYDRRRFVGSTTISNHRYAWVEGNTSHYDFDDAGAPTEGTSHSYKVELDKSTGKWTFYFGGASWKTFTDSYWQSKTGSRALWQGEIYHIENDMPGTLSNKCSFTNCKYKLDGGSYQSAGLTAGNVHSDDSTEWGAEYVDANSFNVWDKDPL